MFNNGNATTDVERNVVDPITNGSYATSKKICGDENVKSVKFSLCSTANIRGAENGGSRGIGGKHRSKYGSMRMLISDWLFLAVLGVLVAFLSITVDMMIYYFHEVQSLTFPSTRKETSVSYFIWIISFASWCTYTVGMVAAAATFVHYVSPQAIGSGIPEMKTIIRGVILKDYLTFRTLVSKVFGIAMSLGSGVPIGKMGPFVHIASAAANELSRLASHFDPAFKNEARKAECLAAACAVGVACTFSAPIGGVLFSIEVTTMYFSVRSYWRGFFAACCGAITTRLLRGFVAQTEVTVNAFFQTSFAPDAFVVNELPLFVVLGILCGVLGAMYISLYRTIVLFLRNNKYSKEVFQRHWIVYPIFVPLLFSTISFPLGLGKFSTGRQRFGLNLRDFFSNCTFSETPPSFLACKAGVSDHWLGQPVDVLVLLTIFITVHFVFSIVCMTLPVPSGVFMPIFVLGAAIGRLMGEIVAVAFPSGSIAGLNIYPGVYAVVGAASFSASVTHTVSVAVMIFEITGQLHYILPVVISVLLSNAVCAYIQPSFFDTIIKIKHLPFLPDIPPSNNLVHTLCAENIMISPVLFVTRITSYSAIQQTLSDGQNLKLFPVVDSAATQTLIGTIPRNVLVALLQLQIGEAARREEAARRVNEAIETIDMHFKTSMDEIFKSQRAKSESSLAQSTAERVLPPVHKEVSGDISVDPQKPETCERRKNRFIISIGKPIEPSLSRRNSLTRRNAVCSLHPCSSEPIAYDEETKSLNLDDGTINEHQISLRSLTDYQRVVKGYMKQAKKYLQFGYSKQEKVSEHWYDLSPQERRQWEAARLSEEVDLSEDLDPAPFHLVKKTSLYKVHSIFSMLQLSIAYVTEGGRLIGVVALSDVRRELERSQERARRGRVLASHVPSSEEGIRRPPKKISTVVDILTPTLEVIDPRLRAFSAEQNAMSGHSRPHSPQSKDRSKSTHAAFESDDEHAAFRDKHRTSEGALPHDELAEAVAYLRRKSVIDDRKFPKEIKKIHK